jgi:predicted membrane-bound spermidine synthase
MRIPFLLFFVSGFCGLLYQVVWLRLGFSAFGVITPVLSVVISVFMLGLALGSWAGGKWIAPLIEKTRTSPVLYYALAEFLIGLGAFVVPWLFSLSETYLLSFGEMDSFSYLTLSAILIAVCILPWCTMMGVTFPFMMAFLKGLDRSERTSFSFLYLANVIGAMSGTLITALVLIELLGFKNTLLIAGSANFTIAVISVVLGRAYPFKGVTLQETHKIVSKPSRTVLEKPVLFTTILFATGFTAMGLEVVWIRAFTPVLRTTVYAFAYLVSVYLFATWVGSFLYRKDISLNKVRSNANLFAWLAVSAFLPVVINDPRVNSGTFLLLFSIFPFCMVLGYLTPKLIDLYSDGFPRGAGRAFAVNILGSILGPLAASYLLLPLIGSKFSMVLLAVPFLIFYFIYWRNLSQRPGYRLALGSVATVLFLCSLLINISYEERFGALNFSRDGVVRRDHTATIISYGKGLDKRLYVNGVGITKLTTITKMMAHWPLAHLREKPESALVIAFGMGTTYRSLMSWPIRVTGVELVPSVVDAFGYYFADADEIIKDSRGKIVIDDGRRFLMRTAEKFDVITIDPPPPVEAAGSSLLYSRDFYEIVKSRLKEGGILHQWIPGDVETIINKAVTRSLVDAFPYVRFYQPIEGRGIHYLASMTPIGTPDIETLVKRIPSRAQSDLLEWSNGIRLEEIIYYMLTVSDDASALLGEDDSIMITDDRPINEYFKLRRIFKKSKITKFSDKGKK